MKRIGFTKQKISQEFDEERFIFVDVFADVSIISSHKGVSKVPSFFGKSIICRSKADTTEIFDNKNCGGPSIAFFEWMDLPDIGDETR